MDEETPLESTEQARVGANNAKRGYSTVAMPPAILSDMRKVYRGKLNKKPTHGQKQLQKMFEEDTDKFLARLGSLEKMQREARQAKEALKAKQNGPESPEAQEVDESSLRLEQVIMRVLEEARETEDA